MNWLDWVVVVIAAVGLLRGLSSGFVRSLFAVLGLVAAVAVAWTCAAHLATALEAAYGWESRMAVYMMNKLTFPNYVAGLNLPPANYREWAHMALTALSFLAIFLAVRMAAGFVARAIEPVVAWGFVGAMNRFLGGLLGLATAVAGLSVALGLLFPFAGMMPVAFLGAAIKTSRFAPGLIRLFYLISPLGAGLTPAAG